MKRSPEVARLSFCFVSQTARVAHPILDPSTRYRCFHPAEVLSREGHDCTVVSGHHFFENPSVHADVYVFHRPSTTQPGFARVIDALRRLGAVLIADYDDLIFGTEDIALVSSVVRNGVHGPEKAIAIFQDNLEALNHFELVITSTEPLARQAAEFNPRAQVHVQPNFMAGSLTAPHHAAGTAWIRRPPHAIGYFAGTRSHDHDVTIVEAVLHRVLCENPASTLLVVGPVRVPAALASLPNVLAAPAVDYLHLPALMSSCTTVIAPLEESTFNHCKSRVKFLEAALTGCRLVATPIPDMQLVGCDHLVLAGTRNDWYAALSEVPDPRHMKERVQRNLDYLETSRDISPVLRAAAGK